MTEEDIASTTKEIALRMELVKYNKVTINDVVNIVRNVLELESTNDTQNAYHSLEIHLRKQGLCIQDIGYGTTRAGRRYTDKELVSLLKASNENAHIDIILYCTNERVITRPFSKSTGNSWWRTEEFKIVLEDNH